MLMITRSDGSDLTSTNKHTSIESVIEADSPFYSLTQWPTFIDRTQAAVRRKR